MTDPPLLAACHLRCFIAALLLTALLAALPAHAQVVEFGRMERGAADTATLPVAGPWQEVPLPDVIRVAPQQTRPGGAWYRGRFDLPAEGAQSATWAVYLPFLYQGGAIWVNGTLAGAIPGSSARMRVRWERPHLINFPASLLQPRGNVLLIHAAAPSSSDTQYFPQVAVGPLAALQPRADRRFFWVRTMPQATVVVCLLSAGFVLFIYWRRPSEVLYGLFGLATALWGVRTLTFVIERMRPEHWHLWRIAYLAATGGFIIVLALFTLRVASIRRPAVEKTLVGYWLAGPLWLIMAGPAAEPLVNHLWSAGLVPVGLAILGVSGWSLLRQRSVAATVMPLTLAAAVLAGVHDFMMAWNMDLLARVLPGWAEQRIFLLHYSADAVLLGMGGLLAARFLEALASLELANQGLADLNATLEARVAERERHLAANFTRMADMEREHAVVQERQLIMREIHDGLGSRLFTSLLRVERGDISGQQIADALRDCIADMRLAFDALAPDDDFEAALGNFLFRWQAQMQEARIQPTWTLDVPDGGLHLARQPALHLLRIAQEALTNVLKHARASHVHIALHVRAGVLALDIADDGAGADLARATTGKGLANMRARARHAGGELVLVSNGSGTQVMVRLPLA